MEPTTTVIKRKKVPLKSSLKNGTNYDENDSEIKPLSSFGSLGSFGRRGSKSSKGSKGSKSSSKGKRSPRSAPEQQEEEAAVGLEVEADEEQVVYETNTSISEDGIELDINKRKDEIMRIVNKEEKIRKQSLFNLRQELEVEKTKNRVEINPIPIDSSDSGDGFTPLQRAASNDFSVSSSQWTRDEETGKPRFRRRRRGTFTDEELANIPRLIHRNLPFKQSKQEIAVVNRSMYKGLKLQRILSQDWYHVILRYNTVLSLLFLLCIWTSVIITFALIYMKIDAISPMTECGLGTVGNPIRFGPAFAFSLETCTTVGYGLPNGTNSFFEPECGRLQLAIYFQMVFSMLFNAFLFAFLFARLARCEQRGSQVLFSDKAIIEKRNGKWLLHVRIYDYASSQPVVEAHVRMYCVSWRDYEKQTRDLVQPHLLHEMRILQPDDELNACLYTSIPGCVTHQIDVFSPLLPKQHKKLSTRLDNGGLKLREIDQYINGTGIMCPVCGETFGSQAQLRKHIQYTSMVENLEPDFPFIGSHRDPELVEPFLKEAKEVTENDLIDHLRDKEIMCVVEGIEPMVSGTFQALQSYKLNDIYFGGRFAPCMSQQGGKIYVDVDRFHEVTPPSDDSVRNFNQFKMPETY